MPPPPRDPPPDVPGAGAQGAPALPTAKRLATFWLLYMAGLGLVFPYQTLYFRENAALTGAQLGVVLGARPLMGMLFQPLWGVVADRTGTRAGVLALIALGAAASYALVPSAQTFPALLAVVALAAAFGTSIIPMGTSVSMASLGPRPAERFGRVRVFGTLGFLVMVVAFPAILERVQAARGLEATPGGPSEPGLGLIFHVAAGFSLLAGLVAAWLPRGGGLSLRAPPGAMRRLLRHKPYRRVLVFAFLAWFFEQAPINLFPLLVRDLGGDLGTLSRLWIPMLALEIPLVLWSGAWLRRLGARGLLAVGVLADGVRWTASALAGDLAIVFPLQLLHGVVVAGVIIGVSLYVEECVPEDLRSSGQSGVAMFGISFAGMLSVLVGGWLVDRLGTEAPFLMGGLGALALGLALPALLPAPERPREAG
jgi:PPP family 3-phenylpropionic acid transporter